MLNFIVHKALLTSCMHCLQLRTGNKLNIDNKQNIVNKLSTKHKVNTVNKLDTAKKLQTANRLNIVKKPSTIAALNSAKKQKIVKKLELSTSGTLLQSAYYPQGEYAKKLNTVENVIYARKFSIVTKMLTVNNCQQIVHFPIGSTDNPHIPGPPPPPPGQSVPTVKLSPVELFATPPPAPLVDVPLYSC